MRPDKWTLAQISTRTILVVAILLNVVAIGLSEVQRRSLTYRIENLIVRHESVRQTEANRAQANLNEQEKRLADLQSAINALQIFIKDGRFASRQDIEKAIEQRLNAGKNIIIRFDQSDKETRDNNGAILCGPQAETGYLGVFIAGFEYVVSYDSRKHEWKGAGPVQSRPRCRAQTEVFGPKELREEVSPKDAIVLWGARFKLQGLDVYLAEQKVGQVAWAD